MPYQGVELDSDIELRVAALVNENKRLRYTLDKMVQLFENGPPNVSDDDCEWIVEMGRAALGQTSDDVDLLTAIEEDGARMRGQTTDKDA